MNLIPTRLKRAIRAFMGTSSQQKAYNPWMYDPTQLPCRDTLYGKAIQYPRALEKIRQASILEDESNPWYAGILSQVANDSVGSLPLLMCDLEGQNEICDAVEDKWLEWAEKVSLGSTLRMVRRSACRAGLGIAIPFWNEEVDYPIKLDFQTVAVERLTTPLEFSDDEHVIGGVRYNDNWVPEKIYVEKEEDKIGYVKQGETHTEYNVSDIIFWYKNLFENQYTGVPECGQAMLLFPSVSRYVQSVIRGEEVLASIPMAIKLTEQYQILDDVPKGTVKFDYEPGMIPTLPPGTDLTQVQLSKNEIDRTKFVRLVVGGAARCKQMPANLAMGDSSEHNMATAHIDMQPWVTEVKNDRHDFKPVLNDVYTLWWNFAILRDSYFGSSQLQRKIRGSYSKGIPHNFNYDTIYRHPDPQKRANATATDLESGATTIPIVYSENGRNARRELARAARFYGISEQEYKAILLEKFRYSTITLRETDAEENVNA